MKSLFRRYATQFSAYQFFNSKEMIARGMMAYLDEHFRVSIIRVDENVVMRKVFSSVSKPELG